jgi:predicted MPP superfamily phosphohydrolase
MKVSRRRFLALLAAAPAAAALYAWRIEPTWVDYVWRPLPLRGLPRAWSGRLLVQLSDLHVGDRVDDEMIAGTFTTVRGLRPDIVVYTGDFISYTGTSTLQKLSRHAAAMPRGQSATLAVLGNHDYGAGWREAEVAADVARILTAAGCTVLRNQAVDVGGLRVGGVDDLWAANLDLRAVMATGPQLVLCHNPDGCDLPGWEGFNGWILSGHTHGGQCKPPFLPPPLLPVRNRRYTAGLFDLVGGRQLYINRGLGHLTRVRFNVRPEVTIFRLEPA